MFHEVISNALCGFSLKEHLIDEPYRFGLLRHYLEVSVLALIKTEKLRVADADLAIRETLSLSPCDILRNGAAFFLEKNTSLIQNAHPCCVSVCSVCRGEHTVRLPFVE